MIIPADTQHYLPMQILRSASGSANEKSVMVVVGDTKMNETAPMVWYILKIMPAFTKFFKYLPPALRLLASIASIIFTPNQNLVR